MFAKPPKDEDLAKWGMTLDDLPPPEPFGLWPENWEGIRLFRRYSTQWRMGPGGPVGMDYGVILHDLDRRKLSEAEYDDLFGMLREIESVALSEFTKRE